MRHVLLLVLCIAKFVDIVQAGCTVNTFEGGFGKRLQCSNVTMSEALSQGSDIIATIMIFRSYVPRIPDNSFWRHRKSLVSLNMHDCGIREINDNAFAELTHLAKLALPNNNLTEVKEQWFADMLSLEQLDLSYNRIAVINDGVFRKTPLLKRLDITHNRLQCLEGWRSLVPLGALEKIRFSGNPLTIQCRGKLTLWLRDHGIDYKEDRQDKEGWLNEVTWSCSTQNPNITEIQLKECVILNMFNQLRTGLSTAQSYPPTNCLEQRNRLTKCIASDLHSRAQPQNLTNGNVVRRLLLLLREAKSAF